MRPFFLATTGSLLVMASACGANGQAQQVPAATGTPVETRPAEGTGQTPAFAGQTRAPSVATQVEMVNTVVASGLANPWGLAAMPDGNWLVTEKPGRLRMVTAQGQIGEPIAGLPAVDARGQGGLLDVVLSPGFAQDRLVFWSYAEPRDGGNGTAVARGVLSADNSRLDQVQVIFRALPTYEGRQHFGSALVFDRDGNLLITTGDRSDRPMRVQAQDPNSHMGKILRIRPDGSVPAGNPYNGQTGRAEIFSLGHRNVQGIAMEPGTGRIWAAEHGTRGGDELNLIQAGGNYGWPDAAYGMEYRGGAIGEGRTALEGTIQPVYYWDPSIAVGNMVFYEGEMFSDWRGNVLVAALKDQHIARLVLDGDRVVGEERLLTGLGERIRAVAIGDDGAVWAITDSEDGKLVRLARRQ